MPNFEFEYPVLRAGAWRAAGSACTTVVVVNNWQEMNVSFALAVHGAPSGATVVRRFAFAPHYNSSACFLHQWVATAIFVIRCRRVTRRSIPLAVGE